MNALGGWCLKSAMASPRSTSLADAYVIINKIKFPLTGRAASSFKLGRVLVVKLVKREIMEGLKLERLEMRSEMKWEMKWKMRPGWPRRQKMK